MKIITKVARDLQAYPSPEGRDRCIAYPGEPAIGEIPPPNFTLVDNQAFCCELMNKMCSIHRIAVTLRVFNVNKQTLKHTLSLEVRD